MLGSRYVLSSVDALVTRWKRVAVTALATGAAALLLTAVSGCSGASPAASGGARSAAFPALPPVAPDVAMLSPDGASLPLRRSALADQWFWLRTKVLDGDVPAGFERARAAMQELRAGLGNDADAWEDLEVLLGSVQSARELEAAFANLPETVATEGGGRVPLRATALQAAREIQATESLYRVGPYRAHAEAIDAAARELATALGPRGKELESTMRAEMGTSGPLPPVVLTLVADAPYAAAFAADDRGQNVAVFVRVRGLGGSPLLETALAETIHALDELTVRNADTAMNVLRKALGRRGMTEADSNVEMAVNTVTFAEAASLVRRFALPAHKALGEGGFYDLYPPAKAIVAAWERHLAGEPLEATADAIARAVAEP